MAKHKRSVIEDFVLKTAAATDEYKLALKSTKTSLAILHSMGSELASAAIAIKLIDVLDLVGDHNLEAAASQLWGCSCIIQHLLYQGLSVKLNKTSEHNQQGQDEAKVGKFKAAYTNLRLANSEIVAGTGYDVFFKAV